MKLIIDITELMWERLKKHSLNWGDIEDIKDSIREGTPLREIKTKLEYMNSASYFGEYNTGLRDAIKVINKYLESEDEKAT